MKFNFENTNEYHHDVIEYKTDGSVNAHTFGNMFIPDSFEFWYKHGLPVDHNPDNQNGWQQPEARFSQGFDYRIKEGNASYMYFGFYRIFEAGLIKTIDATQGQKITASIWCHAWSSTDDNPYTSDGVGNSAFSESENTPGLTDAQRNITFYIGINPQGGNNPYSNDIVWSEGRHIYNIFDKIETETVAQSNRATVFIKAKALWAFKHNDVYMDVLEIDLQDNPQDCYGLPREQYHRTYYLLPQNATPGNRDRAREIADKMLSTVGFSADDAGIGALENKIAKVCWFNSNDWNESEIDNFFNTYYPGTEVEHIIFYDNPDPPDPPDNPDYELRSNNLLGLHSSFVGNRSFAYIDQAMPTCQKFFSAGDAYQAGIRAPGIVSVWRKFVGNEEGRIDEKPTIRESAIWYLDQYTTEINLASQSMGISVAELLSGITAIESLNETIPTFNPGGLQRAVEFDVCFAEEVYNRYGDAVKAVVLNGAVGNPHESEVHYLLPAAQAAFQYGGFIGYHSYWARSESQGYLDEGWEYHAGRWMEWDTYFRSKNVYPRYISTEGGIAYSPDGQWLNPYQGWKSCGSFELYLSDMQEFNNRCLEWNAIHNNRFAGLTIFCYAQWGWDNYVLGDGEVDMMIEWSNTL